MHQRRRVSTSPEVFLSTRDSLPPTSFSSSDLIYPKGSGLGLGRLSQQRRFWSDVHDVRGFLSVIQSNQQFA